MPRGKVEMSHPMASKSRVSKAKKVIEGAEKVFEEIEENAAVERNLEKSIDSKKFKSLKGLLHSGKISKKIELDGYVFEMRSLNHQESRDIARIIMSLEPEERLIEANILQAAFSLVSINGFSPIEVYVDIFEKEPDENMEDIDISKEILSSMSSHMTSRLMDFYFEIADESKSLFFDTEGSFEDIKK